MFFRRKQKISLDPRDAVIILKPDRFEAHLPDMAEDEEVEHHVFLAACFAVLLSKDSGARLLLRDLKALVVNQRYFTEESCPGVDETLAQKLPVSRRTPPSPAT